MLFEQEQMTTAFYLGSAQFYFLFAIIHQKHIYLWGIGAFG